MDANEKSPSKFPRSSLRARNKTVMMAPAEVTDFSPKSTADALSLNDIFDDSDFSGSANPSNGTDQAAAAVQGLLDELTPDGQPLSISVADELAESDSQIADLLTSVECDEEHLVSKASIIGETPVREEQARGEISDEQSDVEFLHAASPVAPMARIVRTLEPQPPQAFAACVEDEPTAYEEPVVWKSEVQEASSREAMRAPAKDPVHSATTDPCRYSGGYMSVMEEGGRAEVIWKTPKKLVGFLVSFATNPLGSYIELREGRLLISSELNTSDNCLLINDASVSAMHAIMRVSGDGSILILDQLSQHGTRIRRGDSGKEESLMGEKSHLQHGDVVIFGECEYDVCILKQGRRLA